MNKRVKAIYKEIVSLNKKLDKIQKKCKHPEKSVITTYHSNTGNYDPSVDKYWTSNKCELCNKFWYEDQ